jgi:antitoxin component of MazEF toxin-antitoxin module
MAKVMFRAELRSTGRGGGHLVEVPPDVIQQLGAKGRIAVRASFNGIPYRGSIMRMGGVTMLGVTKGIMTEAGVDVGDTLEVVVENDDTPREVGVPAELADAFAGDTALREAWDSLSYTTRKEHAAAIEGAKKPETRERRVAKVLESLGR